MLDFGKLYPGWMDAGSTHTIDGDISFKCTKGTHYTLSFDQGQNADGQLRNLVRLADETDVHEYGPEMTTIPYWLINGSNDNEANDDTDELGDGNPYGAAHTGYGLGLSTEDTLNVIATLYEDDLADVVPGKYKDTVTVKLTF